jgi:hypothetical protein
MPEKIKFLPLVPIPDPIDPRKRIQELHSYLDPTSPSYLPQNQHVNVKAVIRLYEEGRINGVEEVCVKEGKIVSKAETFKGPSPSFIEGTCYELADKHAYGHGQFGAKHHEVSNGFSMRKKKEFTISFFISKYSLFIPTKQDRYVCVPSLERQVQKAFPWTRVFLVGVFNNNICFSFVSC